MGFNNVLAGTKETELTAVITKADGRKIDLGAIAYHHRNPLINAYRNALIAIKAWHRNRTERKPR